ncbi:IclR family transcriptional regulator [Rhodobacter sp. HX-7-19]|uniref:IclR family transcriptional regulator n=1 Tax=Paragemmobacter kunshanensis TaxID=2583234 RepID=A0A6M1TU88_9RHOB|nr:IclR family transcriptional regulator [Rhodobacter kunshanensis]NGQ90476.1 IclR family transcriptional regulator [Rhodobacter kunshanensis]
MGTVGKALDLLDLFTRQRAQVGLSEIARLSGLNKATCHRLLTEMESRGLVEQVGAAREYRLGPAVLRLAALRETAVPTRDAAMPVLQALARATGETAHLSLREGDRLVTIAFAYSPAHATKVMMEDADILPWHATSSGQAVLAFLPEDQREALLGRPLPRLTAATETDPDRLRARLAEVRALGCAETAGTFESDAQSLAVPLFARGDAVVGALGVAVPVSRMSPDLHAVIRREVTAAATEIATLWGGQVPPGITALWQRLT